MKGRVTNAVNDGRRRLETHKQNSRSFSQESGVLVKPCYDIDGIFFLSAEVLARGMSGISDEAHRHLMPITDKMEFIVKVQISHKLPQHSRLGSGVSSPPTWAYYGCVQYKGYFCCMVVYADEPEAYSRPSAARCKHEALKHIFLWSSVLEIYWQSKSQTFWLNRVSRLDAESHAYIYLNGKLIICLLK
jgi:hypothetical protein